jgi:cytochrome b subunit of formate dehydrogenase
MMLGTAWHLLVMGYDVFVMRSRMSMLPSLQDAKDGIQAFMYNIGLANSSPQMGRFTFEEKLEYWAFVWGAVVMGMTGFLMWNPITATKFLPGEFIPAAKAAHGGEAVLAVLAIIVWHMYGVHLKRFNKAMWTGKQTEEEMLHEHPLELADIKAGIASRRPDAATIRKRQMVYLPIASFLTVGMLAAIYGFINTEQTALTTVPPQDTQNIQVYVPQTPTPSPTLSPTATSAPTETPSAGGTPHAASAAVTWDGSVGALFQSKCLTCHGATKSGGLNLATYADAMKGGTTGVVFTPGDSTKSTMIQKFESGKHPFVTLTAEELALIKAWLDAGALEK